jgi:hypothetical protein
MKIIKWLFILIFFIGGIFFIRSIWLIYDEYRNIKPAYMVVNKIDSYTTSNGIRTRFYGHLTEDATKKARLFYSQDMRKEYSNINLTLGQYFIHEEKKIPIWSDFKREFVRFRFEKNTAKPNILNLYWGDFFVAFICMFPLSIMIYLKRKKSTSNSYRL